MGSMEEQRLEQAQKWVEAHPDVIVECLDSFGDDAKRSEVPAKFINLNVPFYYYSIDDWPFIEVVRKWHEEEASLKAKQNITDLSEIFNKGYLKGREDGANHYPRLMNVYCETPDTLPLELWVVGKARNGAYVVEMPDRETPKYEEFLFAEEINEVQTKGEPMNAIKEQLEDAGYEYAVAVATQAEIEAGAACGQLSLIEENTETKTDAEI